MRSTSSRRCWVRFAARCCFSTAPRTTWCRLRRAITSRRACRARSSASPSIAVTTWPPPTTTRTRSSAGPWSSPARSPPADRERARARSSYDARHAPPDLARRCRPRGVARPPRRHRRRARALHRAAGRHPRACGRRRRPRHLGRAADSTPAATRQRDARRRPPREPRPRRGPRRGTRDRGRPVPRSPHPRRCAVTAREIAASVRAGDRRAREVVQDALSLVESGDGALHAFNNVLIEEALAAADEVDRQVAAGDDPGPLAGVPVALKDNLCTRGVATTCSSRILEGWRPPYDATVVARLRDAGAVVVGKTNMDEFAMGSSTENSAFGPTRNPHDLARVPGGSSGGSAAAVAAGFAPISLGSDTGGSIRQPAALCGVVGVKPTYGLVSRYGLVAFASSLDQVGPFAANVRDAALTFEVIGGHDPCDSTSIAEPAPSLVAVLGDGVEGLRVGVVRELTDGCDADVRARLAEAVAGLESAGAQVAEVSVAGAAYGLA